MVASGKTDINFATLRFIDNYVTENNYDWNDVTLAGMSKGGTAALVLGSQLRHCHVVALAPQLKLGDYLLFSKRQAIISSMSGKQLAEGAREIDNIMWELLSGAPGGMNIRNCYILTSMNDTHCFEGLDRLRALFSKQSGGHLDVHIDESDFTTSHIETVLHLMPLFVSLLGLAASGIDPVKLKR